MNIVFVIVKKLIYDKIELTLIQSMSTNTYNRKIGHSKHSSLSLEEKIKHKKVMRKNKKMTERFKGIVKNFGATEMYSKWIV